MSVRTSVFVHEGSGSAEEGQRKTGVECLFR